MSNPAPGWYPAPHANGEQRYWDGAQWLETSPGASPVIDSPRSPTPATKGLALSALIVGIVAFLTGLLPIIGALIGVAAIILGIIALARKQSKALSVTGLVLGAVALVVSVVMTIGLAAFTSNQPQAAPTRSPIPTESAETEDSVPSAEPSPVPAPVRETPDLASFTEIDDRNWALIAKDPDSHVGTSIILYGNIMQFDSATGNCAMLVSTAGTQKEYSYEYEQNTMAVSGDGDRDCPAFEPLVEGDNVKLWVTVTQSFSYDTQIGGNTTVPMVEVWQAELLPATEY